MKSKLLGLHIVDKSKLKRVKPVNYAVPNYTCPTKLKESNPWIYGSYVGVGGYHFGY